MWEVEYTDEFEEWWEILNEEEQIDVTASVYRYFEKGGLNR